MRRLLAGLAAVVAALTLAVGTPPADAQHHRSPTPTTWWLREAGQKDDTIRSFQTNPPNVWVGASPYSVSSTVDCGHAVDNPYVWIALYDDDNNVYLQTGHFQKRDGYWSQTFYGPPTHVIVTIIELDCHYTVALSSGGQVRNDWWWQPS